MYRKGGMKDTKPEYALKRAEDLIALGNKTLALEVLASNVIRQKKTWSKHLEILMIKLMSLCVELVNRSRAKDALYQYQRNACAGQPQSLENVLRHFIREAETQAEKSRVETKTVVDKSVVNLLKAVSGEDAPAVLSDRELTPQMRFLWEAYRVVLEILRNDRKQLYKETCEKAFDFCKRNKKPSDFRRLTELLRSHLTASSTKQAPVYDTQESLMFQMEITFGQLNTAVELELWQEAYKSIEDLKNNIFFHAKIPIPKEMYADYHLQLSKLFWVSKNYFFHAYALYRYVELLKAQDIDDEVQGDETTTVSGSAKSSKLTEQAKKDLHSRVLLSALSIPQTTKSDDEFQIQYSYQKERELTFAGLLQYEGPFNRSFLLEDLISQDILSKVHPSVASLYDLLEGVKFRPFQLTKELTKSIQFLQDNDINFKPYISTLIDAAFVRILQQLSQVYETYSITKLHNLIPYLTPHEMERRMVEALHSRIVECRVDHRNGVVHFQTSTFESEELRYKLGTMARNLKKCIDLIQPEKKALLNEKRRAILQKIAASVPIEHQKILQRKVLIEKIKEMKEARDARAAHEASEAKKEELEKAARIDAQRVEDEKKKREDAKAQKDKEDKIKKEKEQITDYIQTISHGANSASPPIQITEYTGTEELIEKSLKEVVKEKKKKEERLASLSTYVDHMVRAQRELEVPLLVKKGKENAAEDERFWREQREKFLQHDKELFEERLETKKRLARMLEARTQFQRQYEEKRNKIYEEKVREREKHVEEWRQTKLLQKKKKDEEKRQREEEERRLEAKKEEEERKKAEEKKRLEDEREEAKRREEETKKREEEEKKKIEKEREETRNKYVTPHLRTATETRKPTTTTTTETRKPTTTTTTETRKPTTTTTTTETQAKPWRKIDSGRPAPHSTDKAAETSTRQPPHHTDPRPTTERTRPPLFQPESKTEGKTTKATESRATEKATETPRQPQPQSESKTESKTTTESKATESKVTETTPRQPQPRSETKTDTKSTTESKTTETTESKTEPKTTKQLPQTERKATSTTESKTEPKTTKQPTTHSTDETSETTTQDEATPPTSKTHAKEEKEEKEHKEAPHPPSAKSQPPETGVGRGRGRGTTTGTGTGRTATATATTTTTTTTSAATSGRLGSGRGSSSDGPSGRTGGRGMGGGPGRSEGPPGGRGGGGQGAGRGGGGQGGGRQGRSTPKQKPEPNEPDEDGFITVKKRK